MFEMSSRTAPSRPVGVLAVTVALIATLVLALSASAARAASPDYVALGDSYSAGSLILPADTSSPLCLRSQGNYPKLTAASLGLSLKDVTCGAATTEHMTTSQYPGLVPPQFDALKTDTKAVTLGIGGNDETLFAGAIVTCGGLGAVNPLTVLNIGAPCRDLIASDYYAKADAIKPKIAGVVNGIKTRSPAAKVFVVGYPDLLPQSGRCWPTLPLTSGDIAFLEQLTRRLNTSVRTAAQENGATYVDLYPQSIGHDACKSASVRWIEPLIPNVISGSAVPLHPNGRGMAAASTAVNGAFQAAGL